MTALNDARDMAVLRLIEQDERISLREIIARTDITSLSVARKVLGRLAAAGYIELPPKGRNRSLRLLRTQTGRSDEVVRLLAEAARLIGDNCDLADASYSGHRWLREYRRWRK